MLIFFYRLSNTVEMADVEEAERLLREAIKLSALDPETGRIDLDLITTGHGSYERRLLTVMREAFQKMLNRRNITSINWKKALEDFNEQSDVVSNNNTRKHMKLHEKPINIYFILHRKLTKNNLRPW